MKKIAFISILGLLFSMDSFGQVSRVNVESRKFETTRKIEIEGEVGYLVVPENRKNPGSRKIKLKYVRLKSLAMAPAAPVVYLEGGGSTSTWQAESPDDLTDWIEVLEVADLIFIDQRGSDDESLTYIWKEAYPSNFFLSEEEANQHYQAMAKAALETFREKHIDITGYTIEEHAHDVNDLMTSLDIDAYSIFGFSFGSHIGMSVMNLYPERVRKAILAGADAPNQAFNFPTYLDDHIDKLGEMIMLDPNLSKAIPDFRALVKRVMTKLEEKPAQVTVKHPLTRKEVDLLIGPFGLSLILRLDIDDVHDIPVIPRLLYSIDKGDYAMLTWFAQKRVVFGLALPGNGINQQLASGASKERWERIETEARESVFGNVVNFPFSAVKDHWVTNELSFDPSRPLETDIPTLFITGTLDCRTPVQQVNETMKGFSNAIHIQVVNAGHEQAMWDSEVFNEKIPAFLLDKELSEEDAYYSAIEFLPLEGSSKGHPSLR